MRYLYKLFPVNNNIERFNINNKNMYNNIETGFIKIAIFDAETNMPIENAKVEVFELRIYGLYHEKGDGDLILTETSDSRGDVLIIELSANFEPKEILDASHKHIFYSMRISKEGYCVIHVSNIIIYPNITNEYKINMSSKSPDRPQYELIITPGIIRRSF